MRNVVQGEPWGLHGFFSTFRLACSNFRQENEEVPMVLPEPYFSLSDSRDTSCAIRFFSEPVPQLRDSWDNTWCYRKPIRYRFPPCKASNLIAPLLFKHSVFGGILSNPMFVVVLSLCCCGSRFEFHSGALYVTSQGHGGDFRYYHFLSNSQIRAILSLNKT